MQTQVRRYLAATAALCVFWLSIRTVKFFFAASHAAIRYLWYGYYFPMLFIPLLCVLVAFSLGKPENYRPPRWTSFLYIPTTLLLILVLTNDLHQLVFVFPSDAAAWLDTDHGYGAGYFIVMGWIALGMVTAIVTMLLKCRIPHSRVTLGLPFVPVALAALYSVLYISRIPWIEMLAGDMTVVQCLLLAAGIESCIRCGVIQSNTGYRALFEASTIRAEITDEALRIQAASVPHELFPAEKLREAVHQTTQLDRSTLLKISPIRGGFVFWQEDISELQDALDHLRLVQDELRNTGDILKAENAQNARKLKLNESVQALQLCEVSCTVRLKPGENISAVQAIAVYDLFGAVLDTGRNLTAMLLFIEQSGGVLRARVSASCNESLDVLRSRFAGLSCDHDEDGLWHLTWTLRGVTA